MPMQYIEIFQAMKIEKFDLKKFDIFLDFAQNIDCGYTLESPCRGNLSQFMFWIKNEKNCIPLYSIPQFHYIKRGIWRKHFMDMFS